MTATLIIFAVLNIVLAYIDAHKIVKGKFINHLINGAVYIALIAVPYFMFHNYWLIAALLFVRLIVFNIMLSLFRGLKWDYISPAPASVIDKLAKRVFDSHGLVMYAVYGIVLVLLLIILYV